MPHSRHGIRYAGQAAGAGQETQLGTIERDHCLICGSAGLLACTATDMLTLFMLLTMSSLTQVSAESVGGIARAIEEIRIAEEASRLRNLRRLRLRAAVLTIDRLLEQLEVLNLQGRSRSLSAWHRRLFSLGRLDPKTTRLELTSETSPQHVMDELFELQERLLRDLAGPRSDPSINGEP
jgi:hypothetical protein